MCQNTFQPPTILQFWDFAFLVKKTCMSPRKQMGVILYRSPRKCQWLCHEWSEEKTKIILNWLNFPGIFKTTDWRFYTTVQPCKNEIWKFWAFFKFPFAGLVYCKFHKSCFLRSSKNSKWFSCLYSFTVFPGHKKYSFVSWVLEALKDFRIWIVYISKEFCLKIETRLKGSLLNCFNELWHVKLLFLLLRA